MTKKVPASGWRSTLARIPAALAAAACRMSPQGLVAGLTSPGAGLSEKQLQRVRESLIRRLPLDYPGAAILLEITCPQELMRLSACEKEPWTVAWLENWVRPGDVLFDVGANVGAYSLIAAKHTEQAAQIFAFEPAFANYGALCRNIVANGCERSITPIPVALGDRTDFVRFRYRMLNAGAALHAIGDRMPGKAHGPVEEIAYEQPMLGYRMDDLVAAFGLPWPHHIKLDVDGSECEVLAGAQRALAHPHLKSVLIELGPQPGESESLVAQLGRAGLEMAENFEPEKAERPRYGLFVPRSSGAAAAQRRRAA